MNTKQLGQIKQFAKSYYQKNDQFHQWGHAVLTVKYARMLARQYKKVNLNILDAACYLHDIGRVNKDDGHPEESAKLAEPFLRKIGLNEEETKAVIHAVEIHAKERIREAETIEAKLLFDSDKIQILSVYGFIRVYSFLIVMRKWDMEKALNFMWDYVQSVHKDYLQTPLAKRILDKEIKQLKKIMVSFKRGIEGRLGTSDL